MAFALPPILTESKLELQRRGQQIAPTVTSDHPAPFLRLFIALAVPPEVRREIARAQGQLRRHSPPGAIRWTQPDQFHVTLKFLGDVPAAQADALKPAVAKICTGFPALRLAAHGIGFFPNRQTPRVIWVGANGVSGQLAELYRQMAVAMEPFAPSEKPEKFTGHITLGRFKPGFHAAIPKLIERAAVLRGRHFGDWRADAVEIIRSELTSAGALHLPFAAFALMK